jgi:predicted TIM-barrel fold metal-dependent hydrolase
MDRAGIEWTMIVAFRPAQLMVEQSVAGGSDREQAVRDTLAEWHELNSWAAAAARAQPDRLKSVVGLDPVLMTPEQVRAEATTQLAAGASGLKIAPMFLGVPADHEAVEIVWQLAVEFDVPVLSESGAHGWGDQDAWGHPRHFLEVVRSYPTLRLQLAHLGQGAEDVMARVVRASPTVITDTALRFGGMAGQPVEVGDTVEKIRSIGAEYVAFGTNYPIVDQEAYAAVLREAGLTGPELRQVGHDNAARLWG